MQATTDEDATRAGRWQFWIDRGGTFTGIVALRPDGSMLTETYGMAGGEPGERGRTWVERGDGTHQEPSYAQEVAVQAGDVFVSAPSGGGFGTT